MFPIQKYFCSFVIERSFSFIVVRNFGRLSWAFSAAVKMLFQSNGSLIETLYLLFFNFKVGTKKLCAEKFVGQEWKGLQNFSEMWKVQFYFLHDA